MTNTPAPEDVLPERIWTNGQFVYKTTASVHRIIQHEDGTETIVFAKDAPECVEYIRSDLCTPAIADGVGVDTRIFKETLFEHLKEKLGRTLDAQETFIFHECVDIATSRAFNAPPQAATDEG